MNPRAPHYKFQSSSSCTSNGKDLESIYGSLRNSFVPASITSANGIREPSSPTTSSNNMHELPTHSRSLVKFQPNQNSDDELLERARSEQLEQNQLAMHTKLLRLSDQVTELLVQRSAFEEEKAQSDEIIKQLRREVAVLKTKVQQHHDKLDVCKRGIDDNAKEVKSMEQRLKAVPGNMESRFQHHATRLDKVESLLRGAGIQIKQHATQLRDGEERISQLEQNPGTITTTDPHNGPHAQREDFLDSRVACLKLNVEKIQHTQDSHKSYLEKTGQTLITHQNNMDTISKTVDDLRSELKRLSTVNAVPRGDSSSIPTDAISRLQNQIDRLAEGARRKINNAESPKSNASSVTNVERLMIQMDEVRKEISTLSNMHRLSEQISLASKISLETMFYQLTKELEGRCAPENIEFGLDEDRIFILRQRVLERLSVEDNVQCEFLRLKESQQMFN